MAKISYIIIFFCISFCNVINNDDEKNDKEAKRCTELGALCTILSAQCSVERGSSCAAEYNCLVFFPPNCGNSSTF